MNAEQKIKAALDSKGYKYSYRHETVTHGPEGREGGYEIEIDEDNLPDVDYNKLFTIDYHNGDGEIVNGTFIVAYNLKSALDLIERLPTIQEKGADNVER